MPTDTTTVAATRDPGRRWFARPQARAWSCRPVPGDVAAFHRAMPGYAETPLVELPALAAELGAGRVFVKDESARFDLSAFKILGASWACARALAARAGWAGPPPPPGRLLDLLTGPVALVTATDGNHGRAVARTARLVGVPALVVVPEVVAPGVVRRIAAEGAQVITLAGCYDDAVAEAARLAAADPHAVLVQDTAWPGYRTVPEWIVEGYHTLLREVDHQLAAAAARTPDLVVVPVGVGSLAQAVVAHHRRTGRRPARPPALLAVEPVGAACLLASLHAGRPVTVPTSVTVMAGLNCGTVSALAWPVLAAGLDAAVAVDDAAAERAVRDLGALGVRSGPSGAASLAGARAALDGPDAATRRRDLALPPGAVVVLLSTEGTQP